jgi:hypothetical protein
LSRTAADITAEALVKPIGAECAFVNERDGIGIRLKPDVAIVEQYGGQLRVPERPATRRSCGLSTADA